MSRRRALPLQPLLLLLLPLLLHGCAAIVIPGDDGAAEARPLSAEDGVVTVHDVKRKPPSASWHGPERTAAAPTAPAAPAIGKCPETTAAARRPKRSSGSRNTKYNFICPEAEKVLDYSEVREVVCPENATGWYPYPPDCRKYLNCWNGRGFLQACSPATLFHPTRRECDYPDKVRCLPRCRTGAAGRESDEDPIGDPTEFADPDDPNGISPLIDARSGDRHPWRLDPGQRDGVLKTAAAPRPSSSRSRRSSGPRQVFLHCNMEGGNGLAPHPNECTKFLNCYRGHATVQSCGPGTVFNPAISACDWPYKVPGCGRGERPGYAVPPATHHHHNHHHNNHNHHQGGQHPPPPHHHPPPPPHTHDHSPAATSNHHQYGPNQVMPHPKPSRDYSLGRAATNQAPPSSWHHDAPTYSPPHPTPSQHFGSRDYTFGRAPTHTPPAVTSGPSHGHVQGANEHSGHQAAPHNRVHNPEWHKEHGLPLPMSAGGYHHSTSHPPAPTTTPLPPPTTTPCPPPAEEEEGEEGDRGDWYDTVESTRDNSQPQSGQMVRLRGGPSPMEGYVEVMGAGSTWGAVCDEHSGWTVDEASVVCRMLGFERGAELAWQGRPRHSYSAALPVHAGEVRCDGAERSLLNCTLDSTPRTRHGCDVGTQATGLRCYPNWPAMCRPGEVLFKSSCYSVVVPKQDHKKVESLSMSGQDNPNKHCQSIGGRLADINSQAESDFVSEWLSYSHPSLGSVLTAGLGGAGGWHWEGSRTPFTRYSLWWPGPPASQDAARAPALSERPLCLLLKKDFPCHAWPGWDADTDTQTCLADYFFWHAEDCVVRHKPMAFICERRADEVGCVGPSSSEYEGTANVSASGLPCLPWDSAAAVSALRFRVSEAQRRKTLSGHNRCRRVGTNQEPWCYVEHDVKGLKDVRAERCDIPPCSVFEARRSAQNCGPHQFECSPSECIPSVWQCDGATDCSNGRDEMSCDDYLPQFRVERGAKLEGHDRERWPHLDANACARQCLEATDFVCKSFSHKESTKVCLLSGTSVREAGGLVREDRAEWQYYERAALSPACNDSALHFLCGTGRCVRSQDRCNGRDDCGDRSDERGCSAADIGFKIRLAGGTTQNEGRIEVKVRDVWGAVCDDNFQLSEAHVACRTAGYPHGALELLRAGHGAPPPPPLTVLPILMDELDCSGNETSLADCDHAGWGVHDCTAEEMVGVRCALAAGLECQTEPEGLQSGFRWGAMARMLAINCRPAKEVCPGRNEWQCESGECVTADRLCDSVEDCKDGSDEHSRRCKLPMEVRLAGGRNASEGRLEVRVFGEWGTVCDDDVNEVTARTVCRLLGQPGEARVYKDAHFGEGKGIIWLYGLRCRGNETSLDSCAHHDLGDYNNCGHNEDVGVACLGGGSLAEEEAAHRHIDLTKYLPEDCGTREVQDDLTPTVQMARVVGGFETKRGSYPWQASVRVRHRTSSTHLCGAVLIGPLHALSAAHCMDHFVKGAYFIRVGDHDLERDEGTEQDSDIKAIYAHEDYNKRVYLENDIVVLRLSGAGFRMTSTVRPACLPQHHTPYTPGTNCSIAGWGSLGSTSSAANSRLLRSAWLPILELETCSAPHVYGKQGIVPGMFCAGELGGGADACKGDSGGAFVCPVNERFTVFGIISWGNECGKANKPGVYSKVAHYLDWVHDKIRKSILEED